MPVESPEMFINVYWVYFLMLLQRQLSNLTKTVNTNSLPLRVFKTFENSYHFIKFQ